MTVSSSARSITRREFGLGAAFLAAAGISAAARPRKNVDLLGKAKLQDVIPEKIGEWRFLSNSGLVVPPEDQLSRALYSQLLTRVYASPSGATMMLLIAQSARETGILQIHRPEICYAAGGYQLSGIHPHQLRVSGGALPTMALAATADARTEQIVYWTRIGRHLPLSWVQQREAVAVDNLHGIIPDAVLARVSTIENDQPTALAAIDHFVTEMFAAVAPPIRQFLMG